MKFKDEKAGIEANRDEVASAKVEPLTKSRKKSMHLVEESNRIGRAKCEYCSRNEHLHVLMNKVPKRLQRLISGFCGIYYAQQAQQAQQKSKQ